MDCAETNLDPDPEPAAAVEPWNAVTETQPHSVLREDVLVALQPRHLNVPTNSGMTAHPGDNLRVDSDLGRDSDAVRDDDGSQPHPEVRESKVRVDEELGDDVEMMTMNWRDSENGFLPRS